MVGEDLSTLASAGQCPGLDELGFSPTHQGPVFQPGSVPEATFSLAPPPLWFTVCGEPVTAHFFLPVLPLPSVQLTRPQK